MLNVGTSYMYIIPSTYLVRECIIYVRVFELYSNERIILNCGKPKKIVDDLIITMNHERNLRSWIGIAIPIFYYYGVPRYLFIFYYG